MNEGRPYLQMWRGVWVKVVRVGIRSGSIFLGQNRVVRSSRGIEDSTRFTQIRYFVCTQEIYMGSIEF